MQLQSQDGEGLSAILRKIIIMRLLFFISVSLLFMISCDSSQPEVEVEEPTASTPPNAFTLLQQKCYSCHNPKTVPDSRIAPTFAAIQQQYKLTYGNQTDFSKGMVAFINNPSQETALMKEAVEQYGMMPKQQFKQEELELIANYLYTAKFEDETSSTKSLTPIEQGKEYALATKAILGKNLMKQINVNGTDAALSFCNEKALHFTDSMTNVQGVKIKRVSDLNRNPANEANELEFTYITNAKSLLKKGEEIKPSISASENGYVGYYPILTNQMCLQCHGQKETEVKSSTLALIAEKYPTDRALGYGENELRGIWVVKWEK